MFKKKYHFGLKLSLLLLFIILLGLFSTSYANTNVTREYLEWIWDYQLNNTNYVTTANTNCNSNKTFISNNFNKDTCITDIYNKLSQYQQNNNITQFGNVNLSVFPRFNSSTMAWFFVLSNSGAPAGLDDVSGFLYVKSPDRFGTLEDNVYIMKVYFNGLNGTAKTLSYQYETRTSVIDESSLSNIFINNSLDVVTIRNCCFALIPHGYYYYNNNYIPVTFQSLGGNFVPSQNDNGDNNSGDSSINTGTITNPSGDITGQIDLSGIEQGIGDINNNLNNIENKIPTSGDLTNATITANNEYWGTSGDLDGEQQEEEITENLNNMISSLSGDLSNNETYQVLDLASAGFLDLFKYQHEDEYYDLKFEWNDFEYQGNVLIPAGSINISQMCRDNERLGYLQSIVRIIFNFEISITLIYQIWNLILSTLGIDNPYLYENYNEVEKINGDTGEVHTTFYKRFRIFKRKGG